MSIKEVMQAEYERDLNNLFVQDLKQVLEKYYKANMSLRIKRGLAQVKARKNAANK